MKWTNINDFNKFKFKIEMEPVIKKIGKKTSKTLKNNPYQKWKTHRLKVPYDSGWRYKTEKNTNTEFVGLVRNKQNYQMTWLLENGHLIVNKKGGVGFARPHPHIRPTFEKMEKEFIEEMTKVKIKSL